ncbi:TerB family tellurite resistance protein [Shimia thalassica]|uniref:tellurite resistance TerB family protein n=1 Tax=Shimia thalassica TaxID=1715693 RepID=UPI0026E1CA11|nr:TerB family tellurite resistance protein [Shimia thalassica]MDO6798638.1 TerB family tellurite resistance protein [Shimia thalassica]
MFESLINRLKGQSAAPKELPEPDERLALGALLVRVAKSDAHYDAVEIGEIDRILSKTYGLNPVEAAKMRATCEKLEAQAPGTPDFALLIRQNVDYPHRLEMLQALRRVIDADGTTEEAESETLLEIENMLGISASDRIEI